MPLTKMFKLGCKSRFFTPPPPPPEKQEKPAAPPAKTTSTAERDPELLLWDRAVEAAELRKHYPDPTQVSLPIPWTYGTEHSEGHAFGGAFPPGRATLFLRTSLSPLDLARRLNTDFFKSLQLTVKPDVPEEESKPDNAGKADPPVPPARVWLVAKSDIPVLTVETAPGKLVYGNVLTLTSTHKAAQKALQYLESIFPQGFACMVPHDVMESNIATAMGTMRITKRTALDSDDISAANLATVFELEADGAPTFDNPEGHPPHGVGDEVVARCVLVYADTSLRPSVGPTIQSIAVRMDYQGCGLVLDLFNAIEGWFVKFWTLDSLELNRVFKASDLKDVVVDRAFDEEGGVTGQNHVLTDKILLYEVMHFSCHTTHPDDPRGIHGTHLPPESHAIKYYPRAGTIVSLPTMYYAFPKTLQAWRSCDNCRGPETVPGPGLLVCGSCTLPIYWRAHYCGRACQREDWAVHKLWCGKTYDEVCAGRETLEASLTPAASS